jgi:hypothetical protein
MFFERKKAAKRNVANRPIARDVSPRSLLDIYIAEIFYELLKSLLTCVGKYTQVK